MGSNEIKIYIVKQSNGITWEFSYGENIGIIYRVFENNRESKYNVATDKGTEKFTVLLLPDDSICVLYQDLTGNINLSMYNGEQWVDKQILKNEQEGELQVYFKATVYEEQIYIIYSILNKRTGLVTLLHQSLDEKNNLSNHKIIDIIKFQYGVPFNLYAEDNQGIFIMYQRHMDTHEIGYKIFNKENENWSDFYLIGKSNNPYKDYSITMWKDNLYLLFIKDEQETNSLFYAHGNNINFKYNKLLENISLDSCSLFIVYDQIWCSWICKSKVYYSFSIDYGENFSNPPYSKLVDSSNIFKAIYSSNDVRDMKDLVVSELYVSNEESLKYLTISDIYFHINNENRENNVYFLEYFMNKTNEIIWLYKKNINQKNNFINELNYRLEEEKIKTIAYEKKFKQINEVYDKFQEGKRLINKNINWLQESLIIKEDKLNELENIIIEKDNEISCLKEKLYQQEGQNLPSVNDDNSKPDSSFFKRIFNNQ